MQVAIAILAAIGAVTVIMSLLFVFISWIFKADQGPYMKRKLFFKKRARKFLSVMLVFFAVNAIGQSTIQEYSSMRFQSVIRINEIATKTNSFNNIHIDTIPESQGKVYYPCKITVNDTAYNKKLDSALTHNYMTVDSSYQSCTTNWRGRKKCTLKTVQVTKDFPYYTYTVTIDTVITTKTIDTTCDSILYTKALHFHQMI